MIGSQRANRIQLSPNHEPRVDDVAPSLLILHYTGMASGQVAIDWLCNPESRVSCHYLVDEDGSTVQMVDERLRAWHAGVSQWQNIFDVNSASIGIEIQNGGHNAGRPAFPEAQMESVALLCLDIMQRHAIGPHQVLAHSDVAPGRKIDPGEAFDWTFLASRGVGQIVASSTSCCSPALRSNNKGDAVATVQKALADLGYGIDVTGTYDDRTRVVVEAFQRRYRPVCVDGVMDSQCQDILWRLFTIMPQTSIV